MEHIKRLTGGDSFRYIDNASGTVSNLFGHSIVVNSDCVISTLTDTDNNNLIITSNISGKTLATGMLLPMVNEIPFHSIFIASGSVLVYGNAFKNI